MDKLVKTTKNIEKFLSSCIEASKFKSFILKYFSDRIESSIRFRSFDPLRVDKQINLTKKFKEPKLHKIIENYLKKHYPNIKLLRFDSSKEKEYNIWYRYFFINLDYFKENSFTITFSEIDFSYKLLFNVYAGSYCGQLYFKDKKEIKKLKKIDYPLYLSFLRTIKSYNEKYKVLEKNTRDTLKIMNNDDKLAIYSLDIQNDDKLDNLKIQ